MVRGHLLSLPLVAAQTHAHQAPLSSQSRRCLTIVTENRQYKQINKIVYQTVPNV
jgi:hypothetical protein